MIAPRPFKALWFRRPRGDDQRDPHGAESRKLERSSGQNCRFQGFLDILDLISIQTLLEWNRGYIAHLHFLFIIK